jgi:hypothetical protein
MIARRGAKNFVLICASNLDIVDISGLLAFVESVSYTF